MINGSEKLNCEVGFELQSSLVFRKYGNIVQESVAPT